MIVNATFVNDTLVRCVAPAEEVEAQSSAVQPSLNGQQFTVAVAFPFFAVHRPISPTTGAATGGTLVTVNGTAFDAGECKGTGHCRFRAASARAAAAMTASARAGGVARRLADAPMPRAAPPQQRHRALRARGDAQRARLHVQPGRGRSRAPLALDHPLGAAAGVGPRGRDTIVAVRAPPTRTPSRARLGTCSVASGRSPRGATTWRCLPPTLATCRPWGSAARRRRRRAGPTTTATTWTAAASTAAGSCVSLAPHRARLSGRRPAVRRDSVRVAAARRRRERDDDRAVRRLSQRTRLLQHVVAVHVLRAAAAVGGGAAARAGGGAHAPSLTLVAAPLHPSLLNTTSCRVGHAAAPPSRAVHSVRPLELMRPTGQIAADVLGATCLAPRRRGRAAPSPSTSHARRWRGARTATPATCLTTIGRARSVHATRAAAPPATTTSQRRRRIASGCAKCRAASCG